MKSKYLFLNLLFFCLLKTSSVWSQEKNLNSTLFISQNHPLSLPASGDIWVSRENCVDLKSLPGRIFITGLKSCSLFLSLGRNTPLNSLVVLSDEAFSAKLKFPKAPIDWTQIPPLFYGKFEDLEALGLAGMKISNLACSEDFYQNQLKEFRKFEANLKNTGLRTLGVSEWKSGKINLKVNRLPTNTDSILGVFYEFEIQNLPRPGNTLLFETSIFEVSRYVGSRFGFEFPTSLEIGPRGLDPDSLSGLLEAGEKSGWAKLVARPLLRTQPGVRAKFVSGGEVPFVQRQKRIQEVAWKDYGLKIELTPDESLHSGQTEIRTLFDLEYLEPEFGTNPPSFKKRTLQNRFDIRADELTFLTSFKISRWTEDQKGILGISSLPIIGLLFSNIGESFSATEIWIALSAKWQDLKLGT